MNVKEAKQAMVEVGKSVPDFTASGYYNGKFMEYTGRTREQLLAELEKLHKSHDVP